MPAELDGLRAELTRTRDAEQQLRVELQRLQPLQIRVHELEELVTVQRAELETVTVEQCRVEVAIRRTASLEESLASLEESLDEARDTIFELKGLKQHKPPR